MEYEVVKLYYVDNFIGWQVAEPYSSDNPSEGYFIKVDGLYFKLGEECNSIYVDESE